MLYIICYHLKADIYPVKAMADVSVVVKPEECSHEECTKTCGTSLKIQTEMSLQNGDEKEPKENGILEAENEVVKDCLSVSGHISGCGEAPNEQSVDRSPRNSSTSDSGIDGSDADHSSSKVDDESVVESLDKCQITDDSGDAASEDKDKPVTNDEENGIHYVVYESEIQMPEIMRLITKDLSEPYSIYTYRYFIHNWPKLCFLVSYNIV